MRRLGYVVVTTVVADLFATMFIGVAVFAPHPRLLWNASASAPIGLYRVTTLDHPQVGDLVTVLPPPALSHFMASRQYLPSRIPLLKHVAALTGSRVCRTDAVVTVNGNQLAIALPRDSHDRPLPVWRGCHTVQAHELFLLNAAPDSFDGRYFGTIPDAGLLGRAIPLLTRNAPDKPLIWRGIGAAPASPITRKAIVTCK
jgi:conjugative transfer signal peptidase TraF